MKQLSEEAILEAAEALMDEHGSTTTLDVKNRLRNQGYQAFQTEISQKMEKLCQTESWQYRTQGRFRVYYLPPFKPLEERVRLQQNAHSWDLQIVKSQIYKVERNAEEILQVKVQQFTSARRAAYAYRGLQSQLKEKGFKPTALDNQLSPLLCQQYQAFFQKKVSRLHLGFINVRQQEVQTVKVNQENTQLEREINAGYYFAWQNPEAYTQILGHLQQQKPIDLLATPPEQKQLLGQKVLRAQIQLEGQLVPARTIEWEAASEPQIQIWEAMPKRLFECQIHYEDGQSLSLSHFGEEAAELPELLSILLA